MHKIKISLLLIIIIVFTACNEPNITTESKNNHQKFIKITPIAQGLQQKVEKAFTDANTLKRSHSTWYDRDEKLPLTIITTAYIDNKLLSTKEYQAYKKLIKKIEKDITLLDSLSGKKISNRYSSIKFVDYDKSAKHQNRFNASYNHRYDDKEILTDILRPQKEKPSQELLIRVNYKELIKGNLTIEGYKTVKQKNKKRNSYYYTLRKIGYSKMSQKEKNRAIINSLIASLQLSIPEYVSVDRKDLVKKDEMIKVLTPNSYGTYTGVAWKYSPDNAVNIVQNKIDKLQVNAIGGKAIKILEGHTHAIHSVAISLDGKYALSGSWDNTIRYWDLKRGKIIKTLKGHTKFINSVAISPDGEYAVSGSYDDTIRYWNLKTGETIRILKGHDNGVTSVKVSPNGKYALSSGDDNILKYWDLQTGKVLNTMKEEGSIYTIAISPNGKYALSAGEFKTIKYWNLKTGEIIKTLIGHTDMINSAVISSNGEYILSGSRDGTIKYWNIKRGKVVKTLKARYMFGGVESVAISPDGKYALTAGSEYGGSTTLRYWNLETGKTIKVLVKQKESINSVVISQDGEYALSGDNDKKLQYWKLISKEINKKIVKLKQQQNNIQSKSIYQQLFTKQIIHTTKLSREAINILYKNKYVISNKLNNKTISLLSEALNLTQNDIIINLIFNKYKNITGNIIEKKDDIYIIKKKENYAYNSLYFTSFSNMKDIGYKKKMELQNMEYTNIKPRVLKGDTEGIKSIVIDSTGKYGLSGNINGTLNYWDLETGKLIKTLKGHRRLVYSVALPLSNSRYALSGGWDKTLKYWDLQSGRVIKTLKNEESIGSVSISSDGKYALSENGNEIKYWNLKTGKIIRVLKGHKKYIHSIAISRDGKYALSGSRDKTLRYWNLETGETIKVLKGHTADVKSVAISSDGKYAISGSSDKTLRYWNLEIGENLKVMQNSTDFRLKSIIMSVAISPDGKYAISGSWDKIVRYWNLKTGKVIKTFKGHTRFITSVAISLDGKHALSGSNDGTLRYWSLDIEKLQDIN